MRGGQGNPAKRTRFRLFMYEISGRAEEAKAQKKIGD
jgi:hypothetical protein